MDYEAGLIGTDAIGYTNVSNFIVGDAATSTTCRVPTVTMPGGVPSKSMDCQKFQHTESWQHTREITESLQQGNDPNDARKLSAYKVQEDKAFYKPNTEYYTLMVFAQNGDSTQLRLKNGDAVWTKVDLAYLKLVNQLGGEPGNFPCNQIFSAPNRTAAAPPSLLPEDSKVKKEIFSILASGGVSKKDAMALINYRCLPEQQRPDAYGASYNLTADFVYNLKEPLTATDGTVWMKAEERFMWDAWFDKDEYKISKLPSSRYLVDKSDEKSGRYQTEPLRTVYIPIRDAHGKLLNVPRVGGLYYD